MTFADAWLGPSALPVDNFPIAFHGREIVALVMLLERVCKKELEQKRLSGDVDMAAHIEDGEFRISTASASP
ncbi:MAG TPA: hypothetical protein VFH68_25275 [Polyangia bacterium]|nr:hypothetical protein [Polyangia bacterium]